LRPQLDGHLARHHKDLSKAQRNNLVATLEQLPVLESAKEVWDMRLPEPGLPQLPHLPAQDGY
jgi:hypothetical protein